MNNFKTNLINCVLLVAVVALIAGIGYGSWKFERWWHYESSYRAQVQEQVDASTKPLQQQIDTLKTEVQQLKAERK